MKRLIVVLFCLSCISIVHSQEAPILELDELLEQIKKARKNNAVFELEYGIHFLKGMVKNEKLQPCGRSFELYPANPELLTELAINTQDAIYVELDLSSDGNGHLSIVTIHHHSIEVPNRCLSSNK